MDDRYLRVFHAICQAQTMSAAAVVLHLSQSTLSYQLGQLEQSLGVGLFERQGRRLPGDSSTRREQLGERAGKAGVGNRAGDYPRSKRTRAQTVTRTPRGGGYYDKRDRRGRFTR